MGSWLGSDRRVRLIGESAEFGVAPFAPFVISIGSAFLAVKNEIRVYELPRNPEGDGLV
jgi:hypothetical protein